MGGAFGVVPSGDLLERFRLWYLLGSSDPRTVKYTQVGVSIYRASSGRSFWSTTLVTLFDKVDQTSFSWGVVTQDTLRSIPTKTTWAELHGRVRFDLVVPV